MRFGMFGPEGCGNKLLIRLLCRNGVYPVDDVTASAFMGQSFYFIKENHTIWARSLPSNNHYISFQEIPEIDKIIITDRYLNYTLLSQAKRQGLDAVSALNKIRTAKHFIYSLLISLPTVPFIEIRYEDLILSPRKVISNILSMPQEDVLLGEVIYDANKGVHL
jgi:hypothetical protein